MLQVVEEDLDLRQANWGGLGPDRGELPGASLPRAATSSKQGRVHPHRLVKPSGCWHGLGPGPTSSALTWAITSWDQMSEARVRCPLLSPSEGLSSVGPKTVARLWRDILLMGSFSATLGDKRKATNVSSQRLHPEQLSLQVPREGQTLTSPCHPPAPAGRLWLQQPPVAPADPGAGQGALPPSRPPQEPLGLAGSPGRDVAATEPWLACELQSLRPAPAPAGYGGLCTSSLTPWDPKEPPTREQSHDNTVFAGDRAPRLSPGQGSRCGNWLCPVLRVEMDFPSPLPAAITFSVCF